MLLPRIARQGTVCLIEDTPEMLELRKLSSMRVSNRIIPPSDDWRTANAAKRATGHGVGRLRPALGGGASFCFSLPHAHAMGRGLVRKDALKNGRASFCLYVVVSLFVLCCVSQSIP